MTQLGIVAGLLKQRGAAGVSAREMVYQHGVTRTAAIIHVLRAYGWRIRTEGDPGEMARYVLEGTEQGRRLAARVVEPEPLTAVLPGECRECGRGHGRHLAAIAAGAAEAHEWAT